MLLLCPTNTHSFVHDKSIPTTELIKEKSRDLQKLPRYLSGIVTSMFESHGGRFASPSFPTCADLSSIFFCYFCLILK